jgi:hypothetical protein
MGSLISASSWATPSLKEQKRTKKTTKPKNQKKTPFHWPLWFPKTGAEEESWKMEREERRKLSVYLL